MQSEKNKRSWKGLLGFFAVIGVVITLFMSISSGMFATAAELGNIITGENTSTKATQDGCAIKIETTEKVAWKLPRQPIDLVILQDTSGSFKNTIGKVQTTLKELTKPVALKDYNENKPRLVFTGDEDTTDRVMINTYQGIDGYNYYSDHDFKVFRGYAAQFTQGAEYKYKSSALMSDEATINQVIDGFKVAGGTPTVPAIDDTIEAYNKIKGDMKNNRKTVFLLITDGVANGYRSGNQVLMDRSDSRGIALRAEFVRLGLRNSEYTPEAQQDYISRAKELKGAAQRLEDLVKSDDGNTKNDGAVVVGFWEDVPIFTTGSAYGTAYEDGSVFEKVGIDVGDDKRSVQAVFHEAIRSVATNDSYYVNEQKDIQAFSDKILKAVGQALVKEDVSGEFEVTEGYKVESVTINGKKVVSEVKDEKNEIRGTVKQDGRKVTISVPESVFNPGDNDFDYELKRTEEAENLDEADEEAPPANYVPPKVQREVGQLVGKFKVGQYESAEIGSKTPTKVEVTDLKYCYPRATKDVKDTDTSNDKNGDEGKGGFIAQDPLLVNATDPKKTIKRSSYAATLTEEGERFTYSVDYNMYNVALEMERNVMFVDALDYRVKYIDAKVTDENGTVLPDFKVSTKATKDSQKRDNTTVIATVPPAKGEKSDTVDEGNYGGHKFKKYRLVITAEIKDQYKLAQNATEYYKMMQENEGRGFANQASIVWNGTTDEPTDPDAKVRRSNNVFVTPPLDTDVTKEVTQKLDPTAAGSEHLNLPAVDDTYYYTIDSTWPGLFDEYMIEDILVPELESLHKDGEDKVYVNGKEATTLAKYLKVDQVQENGKTHDRVYLRLNKDELTRAQLLLINREITKLNEGNDGPAKIRIGFKAKIRENADLSQYRENGTGDVKVPNDAKVTLNNKSKTTKKVTVTPPGMPPKPEKTVDTKPSLALDTFDQVFTYEVKATVPKEVTGFTKFEISDDLEDILTITDTKVTVDGKTDASVVVTSAADANANTATKGLVIASLPKDKIADYKGQEMVLTIKARIKEGVTSEELGQYVDTSIPNKATLKVGDKPNQSEDTENVPVTPPGETPTPTKTVDNQASLNLAGLEQDFTYRVKATVPENVTGFTKFELSDDLEDILTVKEIKVLSAGQEDKAIKVTSVADANKAKGLVTATIAKDALPNYAGKEITLEIKARIKEDVKGEELAKYVTPTNTAGSIPNKATLTVGDKPSQKKETEEVPVTPPSDTPNVSKKINETLDSAVVLPEADYTYNIKSTLPKDISTYKKFNIVDEVDERLTVKGTPVIKGEAANFFKVTVTGQTVTAEITDFAAAKAYAAKEVELIITAQVKKDATVKEGENGIPNQAKVQYRNKSRQDGEPDKETPPTPPVTVTPPPLTKKINDTLDHLDIPSKEDYKYNIKTTIPTDIVKYKKFVITDTLDKDLMVKGTPSITGDVAKFFDVKVDGQTVTATMKDFAKAGDFAGKEVELVIPAQIREGVTRVKIPNTTKVVYNNSTVDGEPDEETPPTPPVTVTPPTDPTVDKKINGDKDHLDVPVQTDYTYNIKASLPTTITSYKKFVITDTLDKDLMVKGTPSITGDVAKFFDVKVDGQTVTATMKDFAKAGDFAGKEVELVIPAQIREGVTRVKIPNTTKVVYNNSTVDGEPDEETPPTPPVTVTPPTDPTVDKKINGDKDHLDVPVQTDYTYNIKASLPTTITSYKKFVITDTLDKDLMVKGTPSITGDVAKFFDVKVDGQTVTATMKDFAKAGDFAGKEVELVIPAQIREGVTRVKIPNTTKVVYNNSTVDGEPDEETPPTPPVTVTPPPLTKKINDTLDHLDIPSKEDYKYNIKTTIPTDIVKYKKFVITDTLDKDLMVKGTPSITGDVAKFFDVKVDGQTVTATMKDFAKAGDFAGKEVELVIPAQIREGVTRVKIPNTTKVVYHNPGIDDEPERETPPTPPVTVTPPTDPTVDKKINGDKDHLDVPVQTDYTYNIKASLPTTITSYKKFVITDTLDKDLMVKGTPSITGDVAKFFDVKVDGQTVTATMKDFAKAGDFAGKEVELVIPAQIREGVTRVKIPNTTKVVYHNPGIDDEPERETPPTPPVTVTPPTDPTVDKKINGDKDHLDVPVQTDYTYNIKASLPTTITSYKKFVITDTLDKDLMVKGTPSITGDVAKFFDVKVDGQTVTATMKDFAKAGDFAGKEVELVIPAQIREGVTRVKIPNTTKVVYHNPGIDDEPERETPPTPPVTVTPPTDPTVDKKINGDKDHLDVPVQTDYTYNIKASLPTTITSYKKFVITDTLDKDLMVKGTPSITGDVAKFFDVKVDGQTVTATMKDFAKAGDFAGKEVELVIPAQIREGVTRVKIPNTTKVVYNNSTVDGEPDEETPPTPPVTVTPPTDPTVDKKINGDKDHLDVPVQTDYTYNIKASLPTTITSYKKFVITDTLDKDLMVKGTPSITGDVAKFFDVKVDGQTVTATMKDFAKAGDFAGKEVELVIPAQIREGVTRVKIPNTTKVVYNNSTVDGEPDEETPPTPPVTVTPPTDPTVDKKINGDKDHLDVPVQTDYTYNIKASLPTTITSYKKFVITDTLDKDLMVKGTPSITGDVAKFFDVKVDGQTVTATMKDFAKAGDFAGKEVELVIPAQIREGVTRVKIPNTTKVVYNNSTVDGEPDEETPPTPPVTVTPPTDPTVDKKINGDKDHLDVPVQTDYTYNIKASLPTTITSYKKFVITDTLDKDLMVKGTPSITGDVAKFFDVKVDGQTVTATMKDFAKAGDFAGKEVELVIPAQIREGVTRVKIPNTTKVVYNNSTVDGEPDEETPPTPPVTVTPPTDPTVDKKINRTLEHLDIERNKSYMYNIYAEIPGDIENYTEYVVTDDVDPALGINGDVAVHVDGYTTDAFKVTVEGNKVTATVVDFAKLEGYKQVQIYIPAYIKEDADLTTYVDTKVPNTASLEFANASGIKKRKETKPVTVTPPTPPTPPTPEPPKPGEPVKTVSNVEGAEQALLLKLAQATDAFRFDVKSVVPIDNSIDNRTILTSLTLMDTLDDNLKVSRVGVKVTDTPSITTPATDFNFIDEDVEVAKQELDEARQKLEALQKDTSTESQEKVAAAEAKVTELQQQLSEAQAVLEQLKLSATTVETTTESSTETTTETSENSQTQIQHQENVVAALEAQLAEAKLEVETVKAEIANAKTAEELKVEVSNQQAIVDKAQVKLTEAEAKQKLVKEKLDLFTQVTEKGELTAEAIEKLGGTIKVDGQNVTVDFSDEATMEALKGRTVTMIIYAEIKDVKALKDVHFSEGIDNTATVQFNHDPSVDLTKKTNKVTVVPPSPNPPKPPVPINPPTPNNPPSGNTPPPGETPPPGNTPPGNTPPGNTPPGNTPPGNTPPGNTPPTPPANHKPNLPATGDSTTYLAVVLGVMSLGLGLGAWVMRKKRD